MSGGFPTARRPEHPDGTKYPFDCCPAPDVREALADPESDERKEYWCESCGHDWSEVLG